MRLHVRPRDTLQREREEGERGRVYSLWTASMLGRDYTPWCEGDAEIAELDIARPENAAPYQTEMLEHSGAE